MIKTWLIGAGAMAQDYIKVLNGLDIPTNIIGRGKTSATNFEAKTGHPVITGGIELYLKTNPSICSHAIVSVGVEDLFKTTKLLLEYGVKNILVEKPGSIYKNDLIELEKIATNSQSIVSIAYNRRFYASTKKALEIINKDGGPISFNFEFTEWGHVIESLNKPENISEAWFLANSTHVVDLAFFLGGKPLEFSTYTKGSLKWHNSSSVFAGAGISNKNALFSYQANWQAPGRWSLEVLTNKHRLIFKPMEKLQIQKIGSIKVDFLDINDEKDNLYKPGLFSQVDDFIKNNLNKLCLLDEQIELFDTYKKIANYN
ncbi:hypothetical protein N9J47_02475 [Flavobacteriaceae bacterium]|nr:hypothetical protein [Flavobacteriaceae bacterium]